MLAGCSDATLREDTPAGSIADEAGVRDGLDGRGGSAPIAHDAATRGEDASSPESRGSASPDAGALAGALADAARTASDADAATLRASDAGSRSTTPHDAANLDATPGVCPDAARRVGCVSDRECAEGQRCDPSGSRTCDPGTVRPITVACADGSCPPGMRCGQTPQSVFPTCVAIPCDEPDGRCPADHVCDPDNATDTTGCRPKHCSEVGPDSCAPLACDNRPFHVAGKCLQVCDDFDRCEGATCTLFTNAPLLGCRFVSCLDDAGVCPDNHRCDPGSALKHHCEPLACTEHADCDCGSCVNGRCEPQPGQCTSQSCPTL